MDQEAASTLRLALRKKLDELEEIIEPAFQRSPLFPGYFQIYERPCGNPGCHCSKGHLHRSTRVLIPFRDGQSALSLKPEEVENWRERTGAYKELRDSRRSFRKWQSEVLKILDDLERARRSTEGLRPEDRQRELR
jgi:hypothetical protein